MTADLRTARLRVDAEAILHAAIAGARPAPLVHAALTRRHCTHATHLLALGKAALPMARAALEVVTADRVMVVAPEPEPLEHPHATVLPGNHPLPGAASLAAGHAVHEFVAAAAEGDVILCLLSGGGSALLTLPAADLTLEDLVITTRILLHAGADIHQLNTVRRHLDVVKGGGLAHAAAPARVLCLALSDVPGDDPAVIASGPFVRDESCCSDALFVLHQLGVAERVPESVRRHLANDAHATPREPFAAVDLDIIGSNRTALHAAAEEAERRGFTVQLLHDPLRGEAVMTGTQLADLVADGEDTRVAYVAGGETTVTVHGRGKGGRNQELALAAAIALEGCRGCVLAAAGTDGVDGNSPAAGAVVDGETVKRLRALGIDAGRALALNDSYSALQAVGDAFITGPTGTNVMDVAVALYSPA